MVFWGNLPPVLIGPCSLGIPYPWVMSLALLSAVDSLFTEVINKSLLTLQKNPVRYLQGIAGICPKHCFYGSFNSLISV